MTNYRRSVCCLGDTGCPLCGNTCETEMHAIRDCKLAHNVWANHVPPNIVSNFYGASWKD